MIKWLLWSIISLGVIYSVKAQTFYSRGSLNPRLLTSWAVNTDGTGGNPANFTTAGQTFIVQSPHTMSISGGTWTVSGMGSRVQVNTGATLRTGTVAADTFAGTLDMQANANFTARGGNLSGIAFAPTVHLTANFIYESPNFILVNITYPCNLVVRSGTISLNAGDCVINGDVIINGGLFRWSNLNTRNHTLNGSLIINLGGTYEPTTAGAAYVTMTNSDARIINNTGDAAYVDGDGMYLIITGTLTLTDNIKIGSTGIGGTDGGIEIRSGGVLNMNGFNETGIRSSLIVRDGGRLIIPNADGMACMSYQEATFESNGIVEMNGIVRQTANFPLPSLASLGTLIINNDAGVELNNDVRVSRQTRLQRGHVYTLNNRFITVANAFLPTLGSESSFIQGTIRIESNNIGEVLNFPFGVAKTWAPLRLTTQGTSASTIFEARYYASAHPNNSNPLPVGITEILPAWWDIQRISGTMNADVQLYWSSFTVQINDRAELRVLHGVGANWTNLGVDDTNGQNASGGGGDNYNGSIIKYNVSSFSPFTIGSVTAINPLPISLLFFKAKQLSNKESLLNWETLSEVNNKGFEIWKGTSIENLHFLAFIPSKGNSIDQIRAYELIDKDFSTSAYYHLKEIDDNDKSQSVKIIHLKHANENDINEVDFLIYPNPFQDMISLKGKEELIMSLNLFDIQGRNLFEASQYENNTWQAMNLVLQKLNKGIYILQIKTPNKTIFKTIIKQ